ncbi:SAM-dependent methyltransferase [Fructilactobacillus cliffordii]|uniref:SAM-dependent methyltransferase n=1 Tax=Fructilactobacillus cliffordii TaxID=2940299 RepID=A0A9Q9E1W3_9LACO|nr:SAM-dependent methyltransferase [Fructilactobacillus cliffordii]USS89165.1 SAM-dependent methyltransferase [Fructilactobacillus cliffordii]
MKRKKLLKNFQKNHTPVKKTPNYIQRLQADRKAFDHYPEVKFLLNHALMADQLLQAGRLPQDLPNLTLPDDIQDRLYQRVNELYAMGDPAGDHEWDRISNLLPQVDQDLRSFRDYLEEHYGMWAYISSSFTQQLAQYLDGHPALEVMAGNGYITKGLLDQKATVIGTDSLEWQSENETGKHQVAPIEKLNALEAYEKYKDQVDYIIMSWSPDGVPVDDELLAAIRRDDHPVQMIVIGEKDGATNSPAFWEHAELVADPGIEQLNQYLPHFDLINDRVYLVK